jgi:hypothetical protein
MTLEELAQVLDAGVYALEKSYHFGTEEYSPGLRRMVPHTSQLHTALAGMRDETNRMVAERRSLLSDPLAGDL